MNHVSRKKSTWKGDDDRISHLSDDILCYILSFIPTIYSVATCVLSKRWEHLWEYVPKLNFDDSLMPLSSQDARFANFVNSVFRVHTPKIKVLEKFSLTLHQINQLSDATKWISSSVMRNIRSLDLNIDHGGRVRFELPSCIFTCKTLESLMLEGNIWIIVPSNVCLPKLRALELAGVVYQEHGNGSLISTSSSLESIVIEHTSDEGYLIIGSNPKMLSSTLRHIKLINIYARRKNVPSNVFTFQTLEKLSLQGSFIIRSLPATICMPNLTFLELVQVQYQDDQIFSRLISSCTSLESLNVEMNSREAELNISSCTLKVIELKLESYFDTSHKLVINASALKYLRLEVIDGMIDYQIEDLPSLEQAVVAIPFDRVGIITHDYCSSSLMNIYKALQHVKSLEVKHHFLKGCGFGHALPMFNRLTELDITLSWYHSFVLPEFINSTTKLKNLTIRGSCWYNWRDPKSVPLCLLTSVKSVSITNFGGKDGEMLMAKYILENARVLEKMEVCLGYHYMKKVLSKKIIKFSRASEKCEVLIK